MTEPTAAAGPAPGGPAAGAGASAGGGPPVYLLASFGVRAKAYVLDFAIVLVPLFALWALVVPGLVDRAGDDERLQADLDVALDPDTEAFPVARLLLWGLAIFCAILVVYWVVIGIYSAVFMARTAGQTPGRRLVGIRVMRADGRPITFGWALYRTLLVREVLFGVGTLFSGGVLHVLQYLWPLWDDQRRTLHDMVARSRVVVDARRDR